MDLQQDVFAAATLSLVAQGPRRRRTRKSLPPSSTPAAPESPAQATHTGCRRRSAPQSGAGPGGQGRGRGASMMEPDFSKKPPVFRFTPAEEAKTFCSAGLQAGAGAHRSRHPGAGADRVRRQRAHVRRSSCAATCRTPTPTGELAPVSRISVQEDRNNDGVYETHTVFVDSLVFPRFAMPFGANAILTMESNTDDVYKFTDTNGDGLADKKELFTTSFGRLPTSSTSSAGSSGRWTTGCTARSTRSASARRPPA